MDDLVKRWRSRNRTHTSHAATIEWADAMAARIEDLERYEKMAFALTDWMATKGWEHCTTEKEFIEQIEREIQRAEQAESLLQRERERAENALADLLLAQSLAEQAQERERRLRELLDDMVQQFDGHTTSRCWAFRDGEEAAKIVLAQAKAALAPDVTEPECAPEITGDPNPAFHTFDCPDCGRRFWRDSKHKHKPDCPKHGGEVSQ